jgi:hypothetical protein
MDPSGLVRHLGNFEVRIIVTDFEGEQITYLIKITVVDAEPKRISSKTKSPPRPYIIEVTQFGLLRVGFTRAITPPTFSQYPEFGLPAFFNST